MKKLLITIFLSVLISACIENTDSPKQVAEKYWNALKTGDQSTAKNLVSKNTQQKLEAYLALPPDQKITIEEVTLGSEQTTIATVISVKDKSPDNQYTVETVLVLEDGQWKVDASRTLAPMPTTTNKEKLETLAQQLSESMQKNIDTMDDAITEGMQLLNETLSGGSKEMGESLLKLMNELNNLMQESIDNMEQRRKQQKPEQIQPDPDQGEGMI